MVSADAVVADRCQVLALAAVAVAVGAVVDAVLRAAAVVLTLFWRSDGVDVKCIVLEGACEGVSV